MKMRQLELDRTTLDAIDKMDTKSFDRGMKVFNFLSSVGMIALAALAPIGIYGLMM